MNNPICPLCHLPMQATNAWRESYTVVIELCCEAGHILPMRVPNSRFVYAKSTLKKLPESTLKEAENRVL